MREEERRRTGKQYQDSNEWISAVSPIQPGISERPGKTYLICPTEEEERQTIHPNSYWFGVLMNKREQEAVCMERNCLQE